MSKAEEFAYSRYPKSKKGVLYDLARNSIIQGYRQAEEDLKLTWEDIREIYCITLNLREHLGASVFGEPLYQEVLKRYKDYKERKEK